MSITAPGHNILPLYADFPQFCQFKWVRMRFRFTPPRTGQGRPGCCLSLIPAAVFLNQNWGRSACHDLQQRGNLDGGESAESVRDRIGQDELVVMPLRIVEPPPGFPTMREMVQWHHHLDSDPAIAWFVAVLTRSDYRLRIKRQPDARLGWPPCCSGP